MERNLTLEFVLTGWVPSKKNLQIPYFNKVWVFRQFKIWLQTNPELRHGALRRFFVDLVNSIRPHIQNSKKFRDWEEAAKATCITQAAYWHDVFKAHGLAFPITRCSITIYHYWKDRIARDNSNKAESIHDMLVAAGIILDDQYGCLVRTSSEAGCYKDEITDHITLVNVTAYDW
jgi:CRISPR/Cas system CSM-associated protein Csm2 small subunit